MLCMWNMVNSCVFLFKKSTERIGKMLVEIKNMNKEEETVVTSLDIAKTFEKEHKNVLAGIRNIRKGISRAEFTALFYESSYFATNRKKNPMFYMNRDGFTLLVMSYTGERAEMCQKMRHFTCLQLIDIVECVVANW